MSIENYSRTHPYFARIQERFLLTGPASTKKTYHISLEIDGEAFPFKVGDSIGIIVQNDPEEVDEILKKLNASGNEEVFDPKTNTAITAREILLHKANIARVNTPFLKLIFEKEQDLFLADNKARLSALLHSHSLSELLDMHRPSRLPDLTKLMPLLPRFYSIANSSLVFPNEIHLTVAYVSYVSNGRVRKGVGSHYLCTMAAPSITPIPIYLQPSHSFFLPEDPNASIILVGPGTGIAPFRAFLQERLATQATGRNWLFFGERNRASDFYYEDFWMQLQKKGLLRLDLAFSRDSLEKTYVQHKMYEERKSLWSWLQDGAYFFLCGDAEEMAKDVDAMLQRIIQEEGNMAEEDARLYIRRMRTEKRYRADVY